MFIKDLLGVEVGVDGGGALAGPAPDVRRATLWTGANNPYIGLQSKYLQ